MTKNILIVESPAKSKTIKKYLGNDFSILASYGHVRDLLPKQGSVEPDNGFAMHYAIIDRNAKHITDIEKALKKADALYLATDPDREGEAISWHLFELLQQKGALKNKQVYRVFFNEITKNAVKYAVEHPRQIDMNLVNAQQARRALDYLVGFNLSPLLWKKVRRGLSAGRVQSPALRLIVEREIEIENFKTVEYWSVKAACYFNQDFEAKLIEYQQQKIEQFSVVTADQSDNIKNTLVKAADGELVVSNVEQKTRKRNPAPPFITSTLQQEAARKLGFSAKKTMIVAQQLYEGVDVGEGSVGLISYMRTDSVHLAQEALTDIRAFIVEKYGKNNLPDEPRFYKTKSKNAQEAHEAIRPTDIFKTPDVLANYLNKDQIRLYELIWKRTVACQMIHATLNTVAVDLRCGTKGIFRANGSTIVDPGFISVYLEDVDDAKQEDGDGKILPSMKTGDVVQLKDILCEQHFTEPPPRFSEASLVKALEEFGIGRPSTYAAIISTLVNREYVFLKQKRFYPTDVGRVVNRFLTAYFTKYVDYDFTAKLEDDLDEIARGEKVWIPILEEFWKPFKKQIGEVDQAVKREDVTTEAIDENCPKCGKQLMIRLGSSGRFIGCSGYPVCDYTRNLETSEKPPIEIIPDRKCPTCDSDLIIREGKYGKFIGCSSYPKCKFMEPLNKPEDTQVRCPECHKGTLLKRKTKRGKFFYSCSEYPTCKYAIWNEPIEEKCPNCGWPILMIKETKKHGKQKLCPQKNCGYINKQ